MVVEENEVEMKQEEEEEIDQLAASFELIEVGSMEEVLSRFCF